MQPLEKPKPRYRFLTGGDVEILYPDGGIQLIPWSDLVEARETELKDKEPDNIPWKDWTVIRRMMASLVQEGETDLRKTSNFMDCVREGFGSPAHITCLGLEAIWRMLDAKAVLYDEDAWNIILQTGPQVFPFQMSREFNWDMAEYEKMVRDFLNEFSAEVYEADACEFPGMDFGKAPWHRIVWQMHEMVPANTTMYRSPPAKKFAFITREFLELHGMIEKNPVNGVEYLKGSISCTYGYEKFRIWNVREGGDAADYEPAYPNIVCEVNGVPCTPRGRRSNEKRPPTHFSLQALTEMVASWSNSPTALFYDADIEIEYPDGKMVEKLVSDRWKAERWDYEIMDEMPEAYQEKYEFADGMKIHVRFLEPKTAEARTWIEKEMKRLEQGR